MKICTLKTPIQNLRAFEENNNSTAPEFTTAFFRTWSNPTLLSTLNKCSPILAKLSMCIFSFPKLNIHFHAAYLKHLWPSFFISNEKGQSIIKEH